MGAGTPEKADTARHTTLRVGGGRGGNDPEISYLPALQYSVLKSGKWSLQDLPHVIQA